MHSSSAATLERIDQLPVPSISLDQPAQQPQDIPAEVWCAAYHVVIIVNQEGSTALHVVNEFGVPDDTLSVFARQFASSIDLEQARAQVAPLLSYLTWQARRGLLWYDSAACLQDAWRDYLRQYAPYRETSAGTIMALVTPGQHRDLHALRAMLARFYTFAIARSTYGYRHPFARQKHLVCLPVPSQFQGLLSPWFPVTPSHR